MNSKRRTESVSDALAKITLEPSKHEGLWSQIERRIDAHESLSSQVGTQFKQKTVKRRFVFGQVWAAVAAVLIVAVGLFAGMHRNDLVTKNQSSVTKPKSPLFTPPRNMVQSLTIASPDGHLRLVGYNSSKNAAYDTVQDFYVLTNDVGKSPQVLYHVLAPLYFISNDSFWFTEGSHEYLAILRFNNVGETLFIQEFARDGRGIWITTQKEKQLVTRGLPILSKLDAKHLLLGNYGVGYETPVIYSFNANGVSGAPASQQFPSEGEVPNSTTRTLYVSQTTDATGSSTFKITASLAPLRMRIGQHLVIRVVYNTQVKLPIGVLPYGDMGDPGPGSLADRAPSPYTNALVFTMVNTAKHGQLVVVPDIPPGMKVTNAAALTKNLVKIPVVVQK